eukprot:COSAG01_NODE_1526_length_10016_cov_8.480085_10_plen_142_part_00
MRAVSECELCFLTRDDVGQLRMRYPELDMRFRRFSRVGERSNMKKILGRLFKMRSRDYGVYGESGGGGGGGRSSPTSLVTAAELEAAEQRIRAQSSSRDSSQAPAESSSQITALTSVVCDLVRQVDELLLAVHTRDQQQQR